VKPTRLLVVPLAAALALCLQALGLPAVGHAAPPPVRACTGGTLVSTAAGLTQALAAAGPGSVIRLAPGTYTGTFVARGAGTSTRPIVLCGPRSAVLTAGTTATGYSLHLDAARYWQVSGFTVRSGQKGVMADATRDSRIDGLLVEGTGDEAVHLRTNSTDNVVSNNVIRNVGSRTPAVGEGIYVGTAQSNWCTYTACAPDRSDRNVIEGNDISATRAESVDIKEGTTGGILRNNRFTGTGMTDADSWVDVKGNGWTISGNVGTTAPADGFQLHRILDGWGLDNVFSGNTATVNGPGFGINLSTNKDRNRVTCTNKAYNAARGLANVTCR
jgi:hypothetical protein